MKLIVGLGNPGAEYASTRHNLGFMLIDAFAQKLGVSLSQQKYNGVFVKVGDLILARPLTYMNLSGDFVKPLLSFFKLQPQDLLVVYDDLSFPVGRAAMKPQGSAAGQKGMLDIINKLGTDAIARLKIGIGAPQYDAVSHVMSKFSASEQAELKLLFPMLIAAIELFVNGNLEAAMKLVNSPAA